VPGHQVAVTRHHSAFLAETVVILG
jgi:hypothetical protein